MTSDGPTGPADQAGEDAFDVPGESSANTRDHPEASEPGNSGDTRNEVGGVVLGATVMARDITGGVHVHQSTVRLPPPNQLPPPIRLTGRALSIASLDAARESGAILLTGPPGVGKTALAVNWGHTVRGDYPDGTLFADLHGHAPDGPASSREVLGRFLRALGVDPRLVPADLAELTDLYRSIMADKRMLVVLDDALTAALVTPLLPPSLESLAVVTSRLRLGALAVRGARIIHIDRLEADAALELLSRIIGDDRAAAAPHVARELIELCERLPLAVCVAGARLAARSKWPISEMVEAMTVERGRLAALRMEDDMAVRGALDISYRGLPAEVARVYRLMSLFPGTHFDSGVAAATAAVPRAEAKRLLGLLTDANLLDDASEGQVRFHDLTRLHAREVADLHESAAARDEAVRRMLDWFLATAGSASLTVTPYRRGTDLVLDIRYEPAEPLRFASASTALGWLDRELPNVLAAARLAAGTRQWSVAWQLADAMWPVFLHRGRSAERLEFDALGLRAAREGGEALGEAKMLYRLGTALINAGRLDQAEDYIGQALGAWRRLGRRDRVAGSLRRLGYLAMARGRPEDAADWFRQALAGYRELDDARHVAVTLGNLGEALIATGHPREAITALEEGRRLLADFPDPYSQGTVLARLGQAHERAGNPDSAAAYLQQALQIMREAGSARGEANTLIALGDLASRAGRPDDARVRYAQAQRILVSLGSPDEAPVRDRLSRLDQPGHP
jgi:tetratricopeptide (TPR) repeat protein